MAFVDFYKEAGMCWKSCRIEFFRARLLGAGVLLFLCCWCGDILRAQEVSRFIEVHGSRPLLMALEIFSDEVGSIISYEDAVLEADEDLSDISGQVFTYRDESKAPRVIVPRLGTLSFRLSMKERQSIAEQRSEIDDLIREGEGQGAPGQYEVKDVRGFVYITPVKSREKSGLWRPAFRLLDSKIEIAGKTRTGVDELELIVEELGLASSRDVRLGLIPLNLFSRRSGEFSSRAGTARDILVGTFEEMGFKAGEVGWDLRFDHNCRCFILNLKALRSVSERFLEESVSDAKRQQCGIPRPEGNKGAEESKFRGWLDGAKKDVALFEATLSPSGVDFKDCWVTEGPLGSGTETQDECFFEGSGIPKLTDANSITGGSWKVGDKGANTYGRDRIGFSLNIDKYYREIGREKPCSITFKQHMKIRDEGQWKKYQANSIKIIINPKKGTSVQRFKAVSPVHPPPP